MLWPLNKACIVPVSALVLLLAMNLTGKRTSCVGTRGLGPGQDPGMGLVDQLVTTLSTASIPLLFPLSGGSRLLIPQGV